MFQLCLSKTLHLGTISYFSALREFCGNTESFSAYVEQIVFFSFLKANNIVETLGSEHVNASRRQAEQKKGMFFLGKWVRNISWVKPKGTSFKDVLQKLKILPNHYVHAGYLEIRMHRRR